MIISCFSQLLPFATFVLPTIKLVSSVECRVRRNRKYQMARGACAVGADERGDCPFNSKSSPMIGPSGSSCAAADYTVLPQDALMSSTLLGRRIADAGGPAPPQHQQQAVYVSSLDWHQPETVDEMRPEMMAASDHMPTTWPCDCRLLPATVSASGFQQEVEHRRCTCTSGRCGGRLLDGVAESSGSGYGQLRPTIFGRVMEMSDVDDVDSETSNARRHQSNSRTTSGEYRQY